MATRVETEGTEYFHYHSKFYWIVLGQSDGEGMLFQMGVLSESISNKETMGQRPRNGLSCYLKKEFQTKDHLSVVLLYTHNLKSLSALKFGFKVLLKNGLRF